MSAPIRLTLPCDGPNCTQQVSVWEDDYLPDDTPLLCWQCKQDNNYPDDWDERFRPSDNDVPEEEQ